MYKTVGENIFKTLKTQKHLSANGKMVHFRNDEKQAFNLITKDLPGCRGN